MTSPRRFDDVKLLMLLTDSAEAAWLADVARLCGQPAALAAERILPAVRAHDPAQLRQLGAALAAANHQLSDVLQWLRLATEQLDEQGSRQIGAIALDLASGWAHHELAARLSTNTTMPFDMLRIRLQQHFQLAATLGVSPEGSAAIVVIAPQPPIDPTVADVLAAHARREFSHGETVASATNGTVFVLAERNGDVATRAANLAVTLRRALPDVRCRVWVEPLGPSIDHLDAHLVGLAT